MSSGLVASDELWAADASEAAVAPYSLSGFLKRTASISPDRLALADGPARETWSERESRRLTFGEAVDLVERLSSYLASLDLPRGSRVGICLPGGSEAPISILAVESAGLVPCLLDVSDGPADLSAALEAADVRALITQSVVGYDRPAEKLCLVAAGFFRLRFLMAFGPSVPDGVIDLDEVLADRPHWRRSRGEGVDADGGIVTFSRRQGSPVPVFRPAVGLVAAALPVAAALGAQPGSRILTCLAPDDLKAVSSGLLPALLTGASLEIHGLFESGHLTEALRSGPDVHLVVPGWMANAVAGALAERVVSVTFVHEAPLGFRSNRRLPPKTVDVIAFDETAMLLASRDQNGRLALCLESPRAGDPVAGLLDVRCTPEGEIMFSGPGAATEKKGGTQPAGVGWISSGFRVERSGETIVGVSVQRP